MRPPIDMTLRDRTMRPWPWLSTAGSNCPAGPVGRGISRPLDDVPLSAWMARSYDVVTGCGTPPMLSIRSTTNVPQQPRGVEQSVARRSWKCPMTVISTGAAGGAEPTISDGSVSASTRAKDGWIAGPAGDSFRRPTPASATDSTIQGRACGHHGCAGLNGRIGAGQGTGTPPRSQPATRISPDSFDASRTARAAPTHITGSEAGSAGGAGEPAEPIAAVPGGGTDASGPRSWNPIPITAMTTTSTAANPASAPRR